MTIQGEYKQLQCLFESAGSLPQLPKSPLRLSQMLDSTDSSPDEIEQLILADPALTVGLLRSASSIYHARSRPVTTVREAIMVLGYKSLRSMAIALWTQSLIVEASKKSFFDANRFTKNGSFVGYFSSVLLSELGESKSGWSKEEVYAGGVLCNISYGLLAVLHPVVFDAVYSAAREHKWSLEKAFCERYEHEIAELGPLATQALGLPEMFEAIVAHVHHPQGALDYFHPLAILNYANAQANANGFGLQRWNVEFAVSGAVEDAITLTEDRISEISTDSRKHTLIHCPASAA